MDPIIERLVENHALAEGPHWDFKTKSLYYIDVFGQSIHKYTPSTNTHVSNSTGHRISFIIPVKNKDNEFVINLDRKVVRIFWDGETNFKILETICEVKNPNLTFNDAKCDGTGRLWLGTFSNQLNPGFKFPELGSLYTINSKRQFQEQLTGIRLTNGITTNSKQDKLYYIDSLKGCIDQFDLNINEGTISNPRPIFTLSKHGLTGLLDGMTIDIDGNLWAAVFNNHKVIKVDPHVPETLLATIELPAKQVTSVTFGGENLDELYVTSGNFQWPGEEPLHPPLDGAIYRITNTGSKGVPATNIDLE